jgi:hypothetical protein
MAFVRNLSKEQVSNFAESVKGESVYFKAGDIDEDGTRIRVIPWVYNQEPKDVLLILEGWQERVDPKTKKTDSAPIRFDFEATIPEGIKWAIGQGFDGKAGHPQTPKSAVCFLFYLVKKGVVKVATFTQSGLVKPISDMLDSDKETYIPDLSKVDIILTAKEEKGKKGKTYNVMAAAQNRGSGPYPDGYEDAIKGFAFSMEEYMACRDPFDEKIACKGIDLKDMFKEVFEIDLDAGSAPTKAAYKKPETKPAAEATAAPTKVEEAQQSAWRTFKTAKGNELGSCDLATLQEAEAKLKGAGKTDTDLYRNIVKGIEELSATPVVADADIDF